MNRGSNNRKRVGWSRRKGNSLKTNSRGARRWNDMCVVFQVVCLALRIVGCLRRWRRNGAVRTRLKTQH